MSNKVMVSILLFFLIIAVVSSLPLAEIANRSSDGNPAVSPFVMSLFRSFDSNPNEQTSRHKYNILRTFENTNKDGCHESQYNFHYNISAIQKDEDVSKAIFRVYMDVSSSVTSSSALLTLMYLNGTDILSQTVSLSNSDFVEFAVAESVQYWLKYDSHDITKRHGFSIRIQYTNEEKPYGCKTTQVRLEQFNTDPVTQPMLAVYSYNHNENDFQDALDRTMNQRQKRSFTSYSTALDATKHIAGSECQRYSLNLTKEDIEYMTGFTDIVEPSVFNIGTCGGGCSSFQQLDGTHSKILDHLTDDPKSDEPSAANTHRYRKCCVPYSYQSITYVYYDAKVTPPVVVVQPLHGLIVDKCKCTYTYDHST